MHTMIDSFNKFLKNGYWTTGSIWEFDWYIDLFFAEVMAYGDYPIKLGYEQAMLGDEFLTPKNESEIISNFANFFQNVKDINKLLENQKNILQSSNNLIANLRKQMFDKDLYEKVQKDLSLLMASVSLVFDNIISKEIQKVSNKESISEQELVAYLVDRSSHTKLNESNKRLLSLYKRHKRKIDESNFKFSDLDSDLKDLIKDHTIEYGWLNTGDRGKQPWTEKDFLQQLSTLIEMANSKNPKHKLTLSQKNKELLDVFIQININDNIASDKQIELDYLFQQYLMKVLKENYIEDIIENLSYEEICELIEKPNNISEYFDRKNNQRRVCWQENGKVNIYYFKNEKDFKEVQSLLQTTKSADTIKGMIACLGIAKGYARIIRSNEDLLDFKSGEIMVAEKTQPSYVPYMTKAAAIVTDIGGVTSHAAIISREFKIPSIVGTKNATKNIQDGDYILVDAEEGIVQILE